MKQVLFIRPSSDENGKIWWCESDGELPGELENREMLSTLASHPLAERVCLLLPASDMVFRHFTVAKKGLGGQATPFSWMAEETLIGEVDDLHWTLLAKKGNEVDAVAITRERLQNALSLCEQAGLKVVQAIPDALLLPETRQGCTLASLEGRYWWRLSSYNAGESDVGLLPLLMHKFAPEKTLCFGDAPEGISATEHAEWQHPLMLIQPQWQRSKLNLLHGGFASTGVSEHTKRRYRQGMVAGGVLILATLFAPALTQTWWLVQQENQLQEATVQLSQHHFPSMKQVSNIKYHFSMNVKKAPKGLFLQMEEWDALRQNVPAVQVKSIEFDNQDGRLTLQVQSADPSAIQQFAEQGRRVFDVTLQSVSREAPYTAMISGVYK